MNAIVYRTVLVVVALVVVGYGLLSSAQEPELAEGILPEVTFFYFDSDTVEWATSAEPERLRAHLSEDSDSQALFEAVSVSVNGPPTPEETARQMTEWIEAERSRFEQTRSEPVRIRMAEGINAYLRDHDFSISNLVEALKRRSGAEEVELVAVHLRDRNSKSTYKLKVILVEPEIEIGKQGFNVKLRSSDVSYSAVTYALGVALYEVHEILNVDEPEDDSVPAEDIEALPLPEPLSGPSLGPINSSTVSVGSDR